jgi:predicted PurR-regulated permease PerM
MKESDHENQHAPLSYHGARRIVWLVFLLIVLWLIVCSLQPMILLFALVFLLAMVLNPIVVCPTPRPRPTPHPRPTP